MQQQNRTADGVIARIATRGHGVVARMRLLDAGVTPEQIRQRLARGSLIGVHRGVYRVGHGAPSLEARYLAAVLACGPGALLSGRAAGHMWAVLSHPPPRPEVTARTERRVPGVATRRSRTGAEATTTRGIPITTVPRTLVDLAGILSLDDLARACHEAGIRHRTTPAQVGAVLGDRANAAGAENLRRILDGDVHVTLSTLERRFLVLADAEGLPLPETNRPAAGRRVDCIWPDRRLTVELDGYRFHHSRHAWEQDRRREREARARGHEFRRYTYGDVVEDPRLMLAELRALLAPAGP